MSYNTRPVCAYGITVVDEKSAKETLRLIVQFLGLGFHPDTPAKDYICVTSKTPIFVYGEADMIDENIRLISEYFDIYTEAINLWHEFGMIDTDTYQKLGGEGMKQEDLLRLVNEIVGSFVEENDQWCCAVDIDVTTGDTVGVRWLELDGTHMVTAAVKRLSDELYKKTGRHFCISHNSPTDGHVLIFKDYTMDHEYDPEHFKKSFIAQFEAWLNSPTEYGGPHSRAIVFQTLDDTISRDCMGNYWQDALKPNFEMWHQVMTFARNGISKPEGVN